MVLLTMITAGRFDHLFHLGHFANNLVNAAILATMMTQISSKIVWLKAEPWMADLCEYLKKPLSSLVDAIWNSVLALDVEVFDVENEPEHDDEHKHNEPTVGPIVTKLNEIFYLNDDTVLDKEFAKKIKRDYSNLVETSVMIRAAKFDEYNV